MIVKNNQNQGKYRIKSWSSQAYVILPIKSEELFREGESSEKIAKVLGYISPESLDSPKSIVRHLAIALLDNPYFRSSGIKVQIALVTGSDKQYVDSADIILEDPNLEKDLSQRLRNYRNDLRVVVDKDRIGRIRNEKDLASVVRAIHSEFMDNRKVLMEVA